MRILFIMLILIFCSCCDCGYSMPNVDLSEALTIYVNSNCVKYSREVLNQYFADNIVNEIRKKYLPYNEFNRFQTFVEMDSPQIEILGISDISNNLYKVDVLFGEVIFEYKVTVSGNLIISVKEMGNDVL